MKRIAGLLALVLAISIAGNAMADLTNNASHKVYVKVSPNIAIAPIGPDVDMASIQTGKFIGYVPFRIDANTQNIMVWGFASYLYKGGDPSDPTTPPITLDLNYGIHFDVANGGPVGGEDNILDYTTTALVSGFTGHETSQTEYEASTAGHFSQNTVMSVQWDQVDPEKPTGDYIGVVRLSAMVVGTLF